MGILKDFQKKRTLPAGKKERVMLCMKEQLIDDICENFEAGFTIAEMVRLLNAFFKSEDSRELREKYQIGEVKRSIITKKMVMEIKRICKDRSVLNEAKRKLEQDRKEMPSMTTTNQNVKIKKEV